MPTSDSILNHIKLSCRLKVQQRGFVVDDRGEYRGWYGICDNIVNQLQYYEKADDPAEVGLLEGDFFTLEYVDGNVILKALDVDPEWGSISIYAPDDITHTNPATVKAGHKFVVHLAFCADPGHYSNASGHAIQPPPGYEGPDGVYFLVANEHELDRWRRWGHEHQSSIDEDDNPHEPEALFFN